MRKMATSISDLICCECGNIMSISRKNGSRREKYHIKDMYCINCDKTTKFIEVLNYDLCKKELEYKDEKTISDEIVFNIINGVEYIQLSGKIKNLKEFNKVKCKRKYE